jgi:hypothetical protein
VVASRLETIFKNQTDQKDLHEHFHPLIPQNCHSAAIQNIANVTQSSDFAQVDV